MAKHISSQGSTLALQAKEYKYKVRTRALSETAVIKAKLQYTIALVKNMDKRQIQPIDYLKR